ncbi:MAG: glucuronate isomerase [Sphaerochaetaceae bacterium]
MKEFMGENFLLKSQTAKKLYFDYAAEMPIFDYHCHLIPSQIAANERFETISQAWLGGDHYKWRAIRANGYSERVEDPYQQFLVWAKTMPALIGNPLYHWTHLELQRYFNIKEPLNEKSARRIYEETNKKLKEDPSLCVFEIFKKFKVYAVGTTDDPADDLIFHGKAKDLTETKILPSFRPDKALNIDSPDFVSYLEKLGESVGFEIKDIDCVKKALVKRLDYFVLMGCKSTDHGLYYPPFRKLDEKEVQKIFKKVLKGEIINEEEAEAYRTNILVFLGKEYRKRNIVMQLHFNAIRNTNSRMFEKLGPDTGYDAVYDAPVAKKLSLLLDEMEKSDELPKCIIYSLNPKDYYSIASIMGSFQDCKTPGKMQMGSGWWFCDHKDGIENQLGVLGNLGLLSKFVGMLTDSRSFLSYPRHEYFRRILCNYIGTWVEEGQIPNDMELLGGMIQDICFNNAKSFFA